MMDAPARQAAGTARAVVALARSVLRPVRRAGMAAGALHTVVTDPEFEATAGLSAGCRLRADPDELRDGPGPSRCGPRGPDDRAHLGHHRHLQGRPPPAAGPVATAIRPALPLRVCRHAEYGQRLAAYVVPAPAMPGPGCAGALRRFAVPRDVELVDT